ncbi:retrovirus-related pol polyprotein from transposon TNT 1-94 [Tanacetum coccineum]|uniref:Retrovirus-related pol polyprotein from transposon TNT 1-94 n=1 Tax=Tanacetum coccineum TaxID=301880 RepID=A0ABQ5FJ56_9ASTR
MDGKRKESCNLEAELLKSQNAFNDLLKRYSQLEKHCISLEASIQLNQEIFQKDESCNNQNALEILEFFEKNDLKAQIQDKDSTICKLKDIIKSLREKSKEEHVNYDYCEIETKNVNWRTVWQNCFQKTRKEIVDIVAQIPSAGTIVPGMFKLDLEPLAPRLLQNREMHIKYLKYAQEQDDILRGIVEQAKAKHPLDKELDFSLQKRLLSHPKTRSRNLGLKCSTSKCGSKPTGNKKNDMISQPISRNMKNKVDARKVNKKNRVVEPIYDDNVKYSKLNANSDLNCATLGLKWKPTDRTFTIVGNSCPLTRITSAIVVPPKKTTSDSVEPIKQELKVYSRKPKNVRNIGSSKKAKIVESKTANHSKPNPTWGSNATDIPSSCSLVMTDCPDWTVRFENDHIARIIGYGDYQLRNVTISRVYYVEGLGHNLFSIDQFCNEDLEVAIRKNTLFIRNLEGVDLLYRSRDTNLYTISLDDMLRTSLICLLSKALKTKSWLWHRRLSLLNFACVLGKSKKSSHQPKTEDTNQEKLYLLHMDLCGPMRVASINGKMYILVIVEDYSRFTWVRFLRTKDEAPEAIIKCIKNIQVRLNVTIPNIRTDNGTEFINQTLREFYENVGISHQTSVARTPQQNDVVERRN